jgi:hypothetical protein
MEIVQGLVDVPLSIDSSVTGAIEAALKVAKGRPLVNSVTGEEEKLEAILPLCKKYDVPVVAISNDETGISEDPDVRFAVAKKIVERAADYGIKPRGHRRRPAGHADRRHGHRRPAGLPLLRRLREELEGQHHLRPVQHLLRPAAPPRHQCRLHPDGHRRRHDLGDHEPLPPAGNGNGPRRQRAERQRSGLHELDHDLQGLPAACRRHAPAPQPPHPPVARRTPRRTGHGRARA